MRVVFDRTRNAPLDLNPYGASAGDLMAFLMMVTQQGMRTVNLLVEQQDTDHFLPGFEADSIGSGLALYVWEALRRIDMDPFFYQFMWDWDVSIGLFVFFPAEA